MIDTEMRAALPALESYSHDEWPEYRPNILVGTMVDQDGNPRYCLSSATRKDSAADAPIFTPPANTAGAAFLIHAMIFPPIEPVPSSCMALFSSSSEDV